MKGLYLSSRLPQTFTRRLLTASVSTVLAGASMSVFAQDSVPAETGDDETHYIEEVVVTGFRGSLMNAIDSKRFGDTVAETLSADDLGGLPDVSMADALTRLPGISAVRTGGQASEINIRGMAGGFVFTTLNGREQVSTSGERNIEFDQYPSELITSAAVYKSPKASLIEGGVAGTVELTTVNPLNNEEDHTLNLNLRGMFNDRAAEISDSKEYGHRISAAYQGKFMDDKFGIGLGYARLFQPSVSTQFVGLQYNGNQDLDNDGFAEAISEGFELQHKGGEETRDGYLATFTWKPTDSLSIKADYFRSEFDTEAFARGLRVKTLSQGVIRNPVYTADNAAVVGGNVDRGGPNGDNFLVQTTNDNNTEFDQVTSWGINAEYIVGPWTFSADYSVSEAESDFVNGVNWALLFNDASLPEPSVESDQEISYNLNGLDLPDVGFNQDFTDLNKMMMAKYGTYPYINTDEVDSIRFDVSYEFEDSSIFSSIDAGVRYSQRDYTNERGVYEFGNDFGFYSEGQEPLQLTPDMVDVVSFSDDFDNFPDYLAIDTDKALAAWLPPGEGAPVLDWANIWSVLQTGSVREEVNAAYIQANIDTELFGIPVTGNVGIRRVDSDQSAVGLQFVAGDVSAGAVEIVDGYGVVNDQFARVRVGKEYTDYLPSLNLNFILTENTQLRFAAAKVMTRPPIKRLAADASGQISDDGKFSVTSKNSPFLDPFYATQYDISYEYYLDDGAGALTLALFYKDIESFIDNVKIDPFDFRAVGFALPQYVPGTEPGNPDGLPPKDVIGGSYETAVNNTGGGYIRGVEVAFTKALDFLPVPFNGLGINGSYSYTESEITDQTDLSGSTQDITLPGLSENVLSVTMFYDYKDFSTRISVRKRDNFVSEQVAIETQLAFFDSETVIDYQASYFVTDNLKLLFQVNNLTDEPTKTFFNSEAQTGTIQFFGRQYFLGLAYSL